MNSLCKVVVFKSQDCSQMRSEKDPLFHALWRGKGLGSGELCTGAGGQAVVLVR